MRAHCVSVSNKGIPDHTVAAQGHIVILFFPRLIPKSDNWQLVDQVKSVRAVSVKQVVSLCVLPCCVFDKHTKRFFTLSICSFCCSSLFSRASQCFLIMCIRRYPFFDKHPNRVSLSQSIIPSSLLLSLLLHLTAFRFPTVSPQIARHHSQIFATDTG